MNITLATSLRNRLLAAADILDQHEGDAEGDGAPYQWSPAQAVRDAIAGLEERDQTRTNLAAFFALLDIEEETDNGRVFKPNQLGGSCRAVDCEKMNKLLGELKAFATAP